VLLGAAAEAERYAHRYRSKGEVSMSEHGSWSRRAFAGGLTTAGMAWFLGLYPEPVAADPPPETTKIRPIQTPDICDGTPLIVADDLLRAEGFTDVQYVTRPAAVDGVTAVAAGEADFGIAAVHGLIPRVEAGEPLLMLGGIHIGCFELFGSDRVRSMRDFKGKKVAVTRLGSARHILTATMAAHVGLDPRKDIDWIENPAAEAIRLFAERKIDGFIGFPPEPQELRAKKIGHVVVNTTTDRPWSQYFCCMPFANKAFVRRHPIATKRALRAILKATSLCGIEPDRAARRRADRGYTDKYDYALQAIKELPYARWREYDAADTVRFYALRLNEVGFIKSSPQKILAQGTDWHFLSELKKELKG
jgi:NitT/TauT family transport system substrate-binding protein